MDDRNMGTNSNFWINRVFVWLNRCNQANVEGFPLFFAVAVGPILEMLGGCTLEEAERRQKEDQEYGDKLRVDNSLGPTSMDKQTINGQIINLPSASMLSNMKDGSTGEAEKMAKLESKWFDIIVRSCVVLILGKRGSGKSVLGYRILELFRYKRPPYVVGIPTQGAKLLPGWMGIANSPSDIPPHSIALVDEAHLSFGSRDSLKSGRKGMSDLISLSRQRDLVLIFITQESRQLDRNIVSSADTLIFKQPSAVQLKFDRPELTQIASTARKELIHKGCKGAKWSYVFSPDIEFEGLVYNSPATFWSEKLSCAFAKKGECDSERIAKCPDNKEMAIRAKEIYSSVGSYRKGARIMNVSSGGFYNLVNNYPYKKKKLK